MTYIRTTVYRLRTNAVDLSDFERNNVSMAGPHKKVSALRSHSLCCDVNDLNDLREKGVHRFTQYV
jgi:hypothetical protein